MNAHQLLANGLDQQGGNNAGVNAAGQCQQNFLVSDLSADLGDLLLNKFLCKLRSGDPLHAFGSNNSLHIFSPYSTVTDFARFFGLSISQPFSFAT